MKMKTPGNKKKNLQENKEIVFVQTSKGISNKQENKCKDVYWNGEIWDSKELKNSLNGKIY